MAAEVLASYACCSLEDAKTYAGVDEETADHDDLFVRLINAASTLMTKASGRHFTGTPGARDFQVPCGVTSFRIHDCSAITAVSLRDRATLTELALLTTTQWFPWPLQLVQPWDTFRRIYMGPTWPVYGPPTIARVTASWGMTEIPEDVREATIQQVTLAYARNVQRFSGVINLETGRVEIPRALTATAWDVARRYKVRF